METQIQCQPCTKKELYDKIPGVAYKSMRDHVDNNNSFRHFAETEDSDLVGNNYHIVFFESDLKDEEGYHIHRTAKGSAFFAMIYLPSMDPEDNPEAKKALLGIYTIDTGSSATPADKDSAWGMPGRVNLFGMCTKI